MITNIQLTTKEKYLLEDSRTHEEECILKYENYANLANDSELKAVFRSNGQTEQEHLQTINQLLSGTVPPMGQSSNQKNQNSQGGSSSSVTSQQSTVDAKNMANCGFNASDKDLCIDMLMTEKYVSGAYDTAIFEFKDASVRDVLNHIQTEEQKHGEAIFAYMQSKGMYKPS
jgi:spore coat protein CotF